MCITRISEAFASVKRANHQFVPPFGHVALGQDVADLRFTPLALKLAVRPSLCLCQTQTNSRATLRASAFDFNKQQLASKRNTCFLSCSHSSMTLFLNAFERPLFINELDVKTRYAVSSGALRAHGGDNCYVVLHRS
jgi:hypothetical protein